MDSAFASQPVHDAGSAKHAGAMLTIGELSSTLGVPTHILRYWETKFSELKPLKRSGNRRYYRTDDVALAKRIHDLLHIRGYTVRGAQLALKDKAGAALGRASSGNEAESGGAAISAHAATTSTLDIVRIRDLRNRLAAALAAA